MSGSRLVDAAGHLVFIISSYSSKNYWVIFYTSRIQELAGEGTFITKWHGSRYPEGLAVAGDSRVYVADSGNNRTLLRRAQHLLADEA